MLKYYHKGQKTPICLFEIDLINKHVSENVSAGLVDQLWHLTVNGAFAKVNSWGYERAKLLSIIRFLQAPVYFSSEPVKLIMS